MKKETSNIKSSYYNLIKIESVKNLRVYNKFINWIIGEFDLYLKNDESKKLKVYFPNGCFSIGSFNNENEKIYIQIKIQAKSRVTCEILMDRILSIHSHVLHFYEVKSKSICLVD
mgnify:CR=1 FL=1|tara:strand:+ start:64398 stop:64742 length:345 start_codon:yes stop_codon:yes gene_type:complete